MIFLDPKTVLINLSKQCKPQGSSLLFKIHNKESFISISYTMGYPHVHGDNPRALASGLS